MAEMTHYWPQSLSHLAQPYDDGASDYLVIAEVSERPINGYRGFRSLTTVLVPLEILDDVLSAPSGIGSEVRSAGPLPSVREGEVYETSFWIDGRARANEKFQTIINAWKIHNREVILPDNVMLMTYGLVPRFLSDDVVCWDDPQAPTYDVLSVKSHVNYDNKGPEPLAEVRIRREYLEDYCSLKNCAAVATYYEERYSTGDGTFDFVLKENDGIEFKLPGRLLGMAALKGDYHKEAPQMSRVWGCRLILKPSSRPISDAKDPELVWPGYPEPMTFEQASAKWLYAYVSDEVLCDYETRSEFSVHPESGGVSYGGWWSVGYCHRIGRNHIRLELKKLYEGCPSHVIAHWHRFAVPQHIAELDHKIHGDTSIATRAKAIVQGYLELTACLEALSNLVASGFLQKDIGSLDTDETTYQGWWTVPVLRPLGSVAKPTMSRDQFLGRAVSLFKLLESLKPAPLRNLVLSLGIKKDDTKGLGSLRLLGSLCQLAAIANEQGLHLPADADEVVKLWNPELKVEPLKSMFALNTLRVCATHAPSQEQNKKIGDAVAVLGIDPAAVHGGWGSAIDRVYDVVASDLSGLVKLWSQVLG